MTYFLEFHTPRGIFTSKPSNAAQVTLLTEHFDRFKRSEFEGSFKVHTSAGVVYLTTEIIRQTVLVIREAE